MGISKIVNRFNYELFSQHLKTTRVSSGLSVIDVSKQVGLSKATIWKLESVKHWPGVDTFLHLCKWMGMNPMIYYKKDEV